ncbi:hypothetical protein RMCBS344292_06989 [Rhizopus microsporus]|nr:hypothetical protein RMCBS344292_06989 [Rhizopus microsporus]
MGQHELLYAQDFKKDSFKMIELATPELMEAFESGNSVVIKGLEEDDAVLCTESKTFAIRQINTSNSLLLVNQANDKLFVKDNLSNTIELQPCLAKLGRIDELLSKTCYEGETKEAEIVRSGSLYTLEDLTSIVQASPVELRRGLEERGVFEYNGYCRIFEKTWLSHLFDALLTNAIFHGLDLNQMTMEQAKQCILEEKEAIDEDVNIPDEIIKAALNLFANEVDGRLKFDDVKVCRFLGEWLLCNPRDKRWLLDEFLQMWKTLGHNLFEPKLEYLHGLFIMYENVKMQQIERYIQYFPISELSTDPAKRFSALFAAKPLWTTEDIEPFLNDLAPTKKEREALLLKYTRTHRTKDTVLYASRIK